ncbi:molecular chaperone DjlA [Meridianimarinicoccus roseus]|jgi:DnaJ like chaperone protein|uniref:Molecular chaperone DjlA n=1 Tax=Meridianimarinicoccus roseus TaxID=2072018 RepID=A0A2V2LE73_9RHOB|nr:TerB family tellurite resistance protein [Meridianimarinicoccus roseus]PWR03715.1 molecular chaperone DjlA [Meridianimarinicoccus roseus]
MSIWSRISDALAALRDGQPLSAVFDRLRTPPERSVAFTIAIIALGAKMAKADGQVTRSEVAAFRDVFHIPPGEEDNAARVFNLARQDVAGFDAYARRIAGMFGTGHPALCDLLEGLFHIALADGDYHEDEDAFLRAVAGIFGMDEARFRRLRARFVEDAEKDPFAVLGVSPDAPQAEVRAAWRAQVRDCHPDRLAARGVPQEAVKLAEQRLVAINRAWEDVQALRAS